MELSDHMMNSIGRYISNAADALRTDTLNRDELTSQGWVYALELAEKADPNYNDAQLFGWIQQSVKGKLLNYINTNRSTNALDYVNPREEEEEFEVIDYDTPHHALMRVEKEIKLNINMGELFNQLSEKQRIVCINMFRDNPLTQRELAAEMGISQQAVNKLTRKVFNKAKAIGEYNIENM